MTSACRFTRCSRSSGRKVSSLTIQSLFPVPARKISEAMEGVEEVIVAEENFRGLYRSVIERHCNGRKVRGVNKIGGMITPQEILSAITG